MAVISNKNIQTKMPGIASNNPIQNQQLAQTPTQQQSPIVQIPVQIQPVQTNSMPVGMQNTTVQQPTTNSNNSIGTGQNQTNNIQQNNVQPINNTQQINNVQPVENTNQNVQPINNNVTSPVQTQNTTQNVAQSIKTISTTTGKTTSWTPIRITNYDLSTSEGQYQSAYAQTLQDVINSILSARFEYNPAEDDLLQLAVNYSTQSTFESMNSKGILNSSMTGERVAKVISDLTIQYQELARQDFENEFNRMLNVANMLMNLDQTEYSKWKDNRDYQYQLKQDEYQKQLDRISEAWNRVDTLGYVDNEASSILGLPVGTLSKDARQRVENMQDELEMYQRKLEMEKKTDAELYELKAQIDTKYNSSSSSSSKNYSSEISQYDNIIQNRFASKNVLNQYQVSANNRSTVLEFLYAEQQAGRLSDYVATYLINKYSLANTPEDDRRDYVQQLEALSQQKNNK